MKSLFAIVVLCVLVLVDARTMGAAGRAAGRAAGVKAGTKAAPRSVITMTMTGDPCVLANLRYSGCRVLAEDV